MKTLLIALAIFALGFSGRAENEAPAAAILAQGDSLTLTDGRVFTAWKIKRQTADSVFIISTGGVGKIDKRLLPAPLSSQFPYSAAAVAAEKWVLTRAEQAAAIEAARIAGTKKSEHDRAVESAKEQEIRNKQYTDKSDLLMAGYVKMADASAKIYAERKAAHEAELAKSNDGLIVSEISRGSDGLYVTLRNAAENPRVIHRTDLLGLDSKGQTLEPGDVRPMNQNESSLSIDGGAQRTFLLVLTNWDCQSLQWKDRADLGTFPLPVIARAKRR